MISQKHPYTQNLTHMVMKERSDINRIYPTTASIRFTKKGFSAGGDTNLIFQGKKSMPPVMESQMFVEQNDPVFGSNIINNGTIQQGSEKSILNIGKFGQRQ